MVARDLRSNLQSDLAFYAAIVGSTTTAGQIIDTADYDKGVMFSFAAPAWIDGTYTPLVEESDDSGMAGATPVADADLIGTEAGAAVSSLTALGDQLKTLGFNCTKRYVRLSIVSSGVTSGATIVALTSKVPELLPVSVV